MGERLEDLEPFYPDRMAQRILGMGDILTLIEKAQSVIQEKEALELQRKMRENEFTLNDFLDQIRRVNQMGRRGSDDATAAGHGWHEYARGHDGSRE